MRLIGLLLALVFVSSQHSLADQLVRQITVMGQGEVAATPDLGHISLGVSTMALSASTALNENSAQMKVVLDGAKALGIDAKDIQTSQISVYPQYEQRTSGSGPRKLAGYQAQNRVNLHIRELTKMGDIIDSLINLGANSIDSIGFSIDNPKPLLDEARKLAVIDAQAKAQLFATAAGVTLGQVLLIEEPGAGGPSPRGMAFASAERSNAAPIEAGETTLSARIRIVYAVR